MNVTNSTKRLRELDTTHHLHPFTDHGDLPAGDRRVIRSAEGIWLTDSEGNRILDGMAGLWCVNVGYGRDEIAEAVHEQMRRLPYYNTFFKTTHEPAATLAAMLAELTPDGLDSIFFATSGSDANDTVLRMVRTYWAARGKPDKQTVIARRNAYHGSTIGAASLGGMEAMHAQGGLPIPGIEHISQPYWFGEGHAEEPEAFGRRIAHGLEAAIERIGEDNIAAFIAEPVQGAGGVIIPPDSYWPEVARILDERDILFVSDEVICGFGRLGEWFGCQSYDTRPDLITMAKGMSSGYLPIAAVAVSDEIREALDTAVGEFFHGYTYSGHPACCAAAIANLEIMRRETLPDRVRNDVGPYLQGLWAGLGDHPLVGEARMKGLMGALELVPNRHDPARRFDNEGAAGTTLRDLSLKNGLVMRAVRDSLIISPPLTITHGECEELVGRARKTLDDGLEALASRGLLA